MGVGDGTSVGNLGASGLLRDTAFTAAERAASGGNTREPAQNIAGGGRDNERFSISMKMAHRFTYNSAFYPEKPEMFIKGNFQNKTNRKGGESLPGPTPLHFPSPVHRSPWEQGVAGGGGGASEALLALLSNIQSCGLGRKEGYANMPGKCSCLACVASFGSHGDIVRSAPGPLL